MDYLLLETFFPSIGLRFKIPDSKWKEEKVQFYFVSSFLNRLRSLLEWSTQKLSNNHNDNVIGVF